MNRTLNAVQIACHRDLFLFCDCRRMLVLFSESADLWATWGYHAIGPPDKRSTKARTFSKKWRCLFGIPTTEPLLLLG